MIRIGFIGGTTLPGNVNTFLSNLHPLLPDDVQAELIVGDGVEHTPDGYDRVDSELPETDRAVDTIRVLTKALLTYARRNDPDALFQVTKFPLHGFAATIAGKLTGTAVLTRYAGDNFNEYEVEPSLPSRFKTYSLNNMFGQVPAKFSDGTIVLGQHGWDEIQARNPDAQLFEIPQPVDRDRFTPATAETRQQLRSGMNISPDTRMLLTVGRCSRRKGMDTLISTARRLSEMGLSYEWYVLGDGPLRSKANSAPGVHALGRVPHDETIEYYHAADLLVHPSLIEGLPNVLLEAAACNLPSIARDVGECSRVASSTFSDDCRLPELIDQPHTPTHLGEAFDSDRLEEAYTAAIRSVIRN